jgi:hypothetical protein
VLLRFDNIILQGRSSGIKKYMYVLDIKKNITIHGLSRRERHLSDMEYGIRFARNSLKLDPFQNLRLIALLFITTYNINPILVLKLLSSCIENSVDKAFSC